MKPVEREVVFDRFVVAFGIRQSVGDDGPDSWEVYARLISGNDVVLHRGCKKGEALTMMRYRAGLAAAGNLLAFVPTEDEAVVDAESITRVFVDRTHNGFTCMIEDRTGKQYHVGYGNEEQCSLLLYKLAASIQSYLGMIGDDDDPDESAVPEAAS